MEQTSMNGKYYRTSMDDIKSSEGWFGKICLLGLISFIPVFGQMTLYGYAYEWGHKAAWGIKDSLPKKIYGRPNSKMLRWGWFVLVLMFVFALIPSVVSGIGNAMSSAGTATTTLSAYGHATANTGNLALVGFGGILTLIGSVLALAAGIFSWVGIMRMTIYDRLGAGLKFGKIWAMIKHDFGGLMRIFGMALLWGCILGLILFIVTMVLVIAVVGAAALPAISSISGTTASSSTLVAYIVSAVVLMIPVFIVIMYFAFVVSAFVQLLVSRALGYWTRQFDVAAWGPQDAPLPFEAAQQQQQQQQQYYAAPQPSYNQQQADVQQGQAPYTQPQQQPWPAQQPVQPQQNPVAATPEPTATAVPVAVPEQAAAPDPASTPADSAPQPENNTAAPEAEEKSE